MICYREDILCLRMKQLDKKFNDLNYELMSEMRLDLNTLYYALDLPSIELGNMLEFDLEKGKIEPVYSTHLDSNGKPCLVIDVDVYPKFI